MEVVNWIDSPERNGASVSARVDECCANIEALVIDWKMDSILQDPMTPLTVRCLVADHYMNIHALIIGLKRLANRTDNTHHVDAMTVRAARKVVNTLLEFEASPATLDGQLDPSRYISAQ